MLDSRGWRRRSSGLLVLLMVGLSACATPPTTLSTRLLPPLPEYAVEPSEIPCGIYRCLVVRKDDQAALVTTLKQYCYLASGDKTWCRMESSSTDSP